MLQPSLRQRRTIRVAFAASVPGTTIIKDPKHEARLVAIGCSVREEVYDVWEMPASLTHWANCRTAAAHRSTKREKRR